MRLQFDPAVSQVSKSLVPCQSEPEYVLVLIESIAQRRALPICLTRGINAS